MKQLWMKRFGRNNLGLVIASDEDEASESWNWQIPDHVPCSALFPQMADLYGATKDWTPLKEGRGG
jgi:hypothetical protein